MSAQQSVYIAGLINLILAAIAIYCVAQAQDYPEYFSLVYVAISIFVFYMVTIFTIIILQIREIYQEHNQKNVSSSLNTTKPLASQINSTFNEHIVNSSRPKINLARSQTLPLTLMAYTSQNASSISISSSTFKNTSNRLLTTSNHLAFSPKHHRTLNDMHKSYRSFVYTSNDYRYAT